MIMRNVILKFNKLYSREALATSKLAPNVHEQPEGITCPGIYIWGFLNDKGSFIPYYVGKSQSNIKSRLLRHITDICKPDSTYMSFSDSYMDNFYMDPNYPEFRKKTSRLKVPDRLPIDYFRDKIEYLNNIHWPNRKPRVNTLKRLIDSGKFRLCYANFPSELNPVSHILETFVKFSLKGKTVGDSLSFNTLEKYHHRPGAIDVNNFIIRINADPSLRQLFYYDSGHITAKSFTTRKMTSDMYSETSNS